MRCRVPASRAYPPPSCPERMEMEATPVRWDPMAPDRQPWQPSARPRSGNDADPPIARHPESDRKTLRPPIPVQGAGRDIALSEKRCDRVPPQDTMARLAVAKLEAAPVAGPQPGLVEEGEAE